MFLEGIDELGRFRFGEVCWQVFPSFLRERAQVGLLRARHRLLSGDPVLRIFLRLRCDFVAHGGFVPPSDRYKRTFAIPRARCSATLFGRHEHEAAVDDERLPGGV